MVTVTSIADRILKESGYDSASVDDTESTALTIVEYLVDDAINWLNAECNTSIVALAGVAASKSLTGTESEVAAVKLLSKLYLKARQDKGESVSVGGLAVSPVASDTFVEIHDEKLNRLLTKLKELDADHE